MAAQRERIFEALFTRLSAIQSAAEGQVFFKYASRVFYGFDNVPSGLRPVLLLCKGDETGGVKTPGLPSGWLLRADVVIYIDPLATTIETPAQSPDTLINEAITLVEAALEMQPDERAASLPPFVARPPGQFTTTLGGLCYSCQIDGTVQIIDGSASGTIQILIPIAILTTG